MFGPRVINHQNFKFGAHYLHSIGENEVDKGDQWRSKSPKGEIGKEVTV